MDTNRFISQLIVGVALSMPLLAMDIAASQAQVSSLPASRNQITGVRLVPSGGRMKLEIDTAGGARPQVFFTQQGNAWVGDITNAELKLSEGARQEKPLPGVKLLEVTQLDKSSVRVQIIGETRAPQGLLAERTSSRLVFDFNSLEPAPPAVVASQPAIPVGSATPATAPVRPVAAPVQPPATTATGPAAAPAKPVPAPKPTLLSLPPRSSRPPIPVASSSAPAPTTTAPTTTTAVSPPQPAPARPTLLTPPPRSPVTSSGPTPTTAAPASPPAATTIAQAPPPARPLEIATRPSFGARAVAPPSGDIAISDIQIPLNTVDLGSTRTISLTLRNAPVGDVLSLLIRRAGLNIVLNDVPPPTDPDGVVSLDVKDSPLQETFDFILRLKGLQAIRREQTVFVGRTLPGIDQQIVRNYRINQSTPGDIVNFLQSLAVEGGPLVGAQFITDERTNSLTAIATANQQAVIAAQIAQLDVREWQVLVDVQVLSISDSIPVASLFNVGPAQSGNFTYTDGGINFNSASDFANQLQASVNRRRDSFTKTLANPKIVCAQGEDCRIDIGTSVVTNVTSSTDPATGVLTQTLVFDTLGVSLNLSRTRIDGNGFVSFDSFTPSVSTIGSTFTRADGTVITQLNRNSVNLGKVRFRDGETYVLSGLIQETESQSISKIPLLGDIPILGQLFRTESNGRDRNEIVFMITPYVLRDGLTREGVPISQTGTEPFVATQP